MERRCEYSVLTIPNDPSYVAIAAAHVGQVARKIGFDEHDEQMIQTAVSEAVRNVIDQSFDVGERADLWILCEQAPLGLEVVVKDRGLPTDTRSLEQCLVSPGGQEETGPCRGISVMRDCMDEVAFNYLGPDGNEIVLVKYLKTKTLEDYFEACNLEPYAPAALQEEGKTAEFIVRPMKPSEAIEVARNMYRTYEYSYSYQHVYYPERIAELSESGHLYVAVAVTPDGEIAGNCALIKKERISTIAEMGMGAVKPRFRGQGVFTRLTEHLIEKAESENLMGVFGQAVTLHTYSQQTGSASGLRDCAIALAYVPADVVFRGFRENLSQRETLLIHFMYIHKPAGMEIHLPLHHRDMIVTLYNNLGMSPNVVTSDSFVEPTIEPIVKTHSPGLKGFARIDVQRYGRAVVQEVRARLQGLRVKHAEVIHLYLNLSDPGTAEYCKRFEELGFFFAGMLPGGCGADALILQYLNNIALDYDRIKLQSALGRDLLAYIKSRDPARM